MPEPITREETYLAAAAGQSVTLPTPVTREELFLAKLAGENVTTPTPVTRKEMFLEAAAQGGGGGGVTVEPLSVSENGVYTAPSGKAYSPVNVEVPTRDPYLYENVYALQLSRTANTWTGDPTITIDCSHMRDCSNLCNGGSGNPGYKKVKLINVPNSAISFNSAFSGHNASSAFESVELDGDIIASAGTGMFYSNRPLKTITGGRIDLSAASVLSNYAKYCYGLETISFVPSCIKASIPFDSASLLTDASLVSIANALDGTVTGQTLTLHATPKATCQTLMGTVADGLFTADASGTVTLADFITTTKGWTLA